jgi:hypothetical protein
MVIKHVIASILVLQQFILNEQITTLMIMFFSSSKEAIQKTKWCGAMKGLEDSWSDTFWVVFLKECFANI